MPKRVLFICTGNFYRSRFAEAVFNHHCESLGLNWRAFSRGIAVHLVQGDISPLAEEELKRRGIPLTHTSSSRVQLTEIDLRRADIIIALREKEHRGPIEAAFPRWAKRIEYWDVADIDHDHPENAFAQIEEQVFALISKIQREPPSILAFLSRLFRGRHP